MENRTDGAKVKVKIMSFLKSVNFTKSFSSVNNKVQKSIKKRVTVRDEFELEFSGSSEPEL